VNVHAFLLRHRGAAEPPWLAEAAQKGETAAAISKLAIAGTDELAIEALDLVIGFYGAEAGNLALKTMATGGVWVGGGIAPKILPRLIGPRFTNAFRDKGRMRPLLDAMPVRVVNEDRTALLGAAWHAAFEQVKGE
jgi:glucokinase